MKYGCVSFIDLVWSDSKIPVYVPDVQATDHLEYTFLLQQLKHASRFKKM